MILLGVVVAWVWATWMRSYTALCEQRSSVLKANVGREEDYMGSAELGRDSDSAGYC